MKSLDKQKMELIVLTKINNKLILISNVNTLFFNPTST